MPDIQHGSSSYRLSFNQSRHSTQLQFQAASKLDLLSTLSCSTSEASPVGSPIPHAKDRPDLHSSTRVQNGAGMCNESQTENGITHEECSDMEIEYISLPKLKRDIRRAGLTGEVGRWVHSVVERCPMVPPGVAPVTNRKRLRA